MTTPRPKKLRVTPQQRIQVLVSICQVQAHLLGLRDREIATLKKALARAKRRPPLPK